MTTNVENVTETTTPEVATTRNRRVWDGMGMKVNGLKTAEEVITATGLDWEVDKQPVFIQRDDEFFVVPGQYANIRSDNKDILGIVGENYNVLQNRQAFTMFDQVAERGDAIYDTAGALRGGSMIWMLAKIPGLMRVGTGDDILEKYLLLSNSHDGSMSVNIALTNIRVICENTLVAALRTAKQRFSIKHSGKLNEQLEKATEAIGIANRSFTEMEDAFNAMRGFNLNDLDAKLFVERVLTPAAPKRRVSAKSDILVLPPGVNLGNGDKEVDAEAQEEAKKKEKRAISQILEIYKSDSDKFNFKDDENTLWRAFNAVTAWTNHARNYREHERSSNTTADNRLHSVFFGQSADLNLRALEEAQRMIKEGPSVSKPTVFPVAVDLSQADTVNVEIKSVGNVGGEETTKAIADAIETSKPAATAKANSKAKNKSKGKTEAKKAEVAEPATV